MQWNSSPYSESDLCSFSPTEVCFPHRHRKDAAWEAQGSLLVCILRWKPSLHDIDILFGQEFFFNEQHKGRQQTKEQALFGSFADDSDEDEGDRRGRKRRKEDLSKPVAFVSHGITGSSTDKPKDVEKVEHQVQDAEDAFSGQGLGFSQGGLGFAPAAEQEEDQEVDIAELPTSFGQRYAPSIVSERKAASHSQDIL